LARAASSRSLVPSHVVSLKSNAAALAGIAKMSALANASTSDTKRDQRGLGKPG
jgi:hypothetical protein